MAGPPKQDVRTPDTPFPEELRAQALVLGEVGATASSLAAGHSSIMGMTSCS